MTCRIQTRRNGGECIALTKGFETAGVGALAGGAIALHGAGSAAVATADMAKILKQLYQLNMSANGGSDANGENQIPKDFKETKEFGKPHGQKVYRKGNLYYSRDVATKAGKSHNGGIWKVFKRVGTKLITQI